VCNAFLGPWAKRAVGGGHTPETVQQRASSGSLETEDPEEHSHFEWSEAVPVDVLAGDDTSRGMQGPLDVSCAEVGGGPEGVGTDVRCHGEGDSREAGAHIV
jgi:hypothetical protein